MQIQISTQVTETKTVDIEPGYYKGRLLSETFYLLTPYGTLVYIAKTFSSISSPHSSSYAREMQELVKDYIPCDQSEFDVAKDKYLCHLAHYVSFPELATAVNPDAKEHRINTMVDPNLQQAELANQQATEQQKALECASQDQAMEVDSEEGSIG